VLKADLEQLSITESHFEGARLGADPHFHERHVDSFYVLDGELAFQVDDEEHTLGPGAFLAVPAGLVHGFRSTSPARFLNFHTPDGAFAGHVRARDRGEEGGFDSVPAAAGDGLPASSAILLHAREGERLEANNRIATIKAGMDELALIEFELLPGFTGPEPHTHDDHVDAFYVLDGEVEFQVGDEKLLLGAGAFVAAPVGVVHTFANGPGRSRVLNVHAPSAGFHEWLRELG